jgi:selenocysteine lyase/cysteine desulfurase
MEAAVGYLETLGRTMARNEEDRKSESRRTALQRAFAAIRDYEESLTVEMLRVLDDCGASVYGVKDKKRARERVPTLCFTLPHLSPATVAEELAKQNIGVRDGHMYAPRFMKRLGLPQASGAVRASLVHYNTVEEVRRFGGALAELTGKRFPPAPGNSSC